jgi:hypothetical protein
VDWRILPAKRREPDYFGEQELALIYVAKKLKEALALEAVLTEAAVEYLVEADRYTGGIIFRTERVGAFFYVLPEAQETARRVLAQHGYRPHEPLEGATG